MDAKPEEEGRRRRPEPAPAAAAEPAKIDTTSAAATGWTPAEDKELRALIAREGSGSWREKAAAFRTGRSAGALRYRWSLLNEGAEDENANELVIPDVATIGEQLWRRTLAVGFACQCLHQDEWYEVKVVDVKTEEVNLRKNGDMVKVHYQGWASKWDE